MPVPNRFPSTQEILRIQTETEYHSLFNCDFFNTVFKRTWFLLQEFFGRDVEKQKILSVTMDLTPALIGAGSDFLFGEEVKIEVQGKAGPNQAIQDAVDAMIKRNNLQQKFYDSSKPFQYIGHTQFKVRKEIDAKGKAVAYFDEIPYNTWYPDWTSLPEGATPTTYRVVAYLSELATDDIPVKKYIYVEEYTAGQIAYYLFENVDGKTGQQLDFSNVPNLLPKRDGQTFQGLTVIEKTGLDGIAVVEINADKTVKDRCGQSLLKPARPLLDELNARMTQMSLQIFKHMDPILQAPKSGVPIDPKTGEVQRKKLEVYLTEPNDGDVKYITNDNPMLEETFKFLEMLREGIAKVTKTPQSFIMSDEKGGVESVEALRTRFMLFLKRIRGYRRSYSPAIEQLLRMGLQIEGITVPPDTEFKFTYDYGLPKDPSEEVQTWGTAVQDGISSVETAVRQFQGIEGDLLTEEMARITKDHELLPPVGFTPQNNAKPPNELNVQ